MAASATDDFLASVVRAMPPMDYAVAYGSGVFEQHLCSGAAPARDSAQLEGGAADAGKMVDFLFAVADPVAWHAANLRANRSHYSAFGVLGPRAVAHLQQAYGARVYFNTAVPHPAPEARAPAGRLIKYGVISMADLSADLLGWETLYVSGRLHKPVRTLVGPPEPLERALAANHASALSAALLQLPAHFPELELYRALAGLSYAGDVRMGVAEDPRKVDKLVRPHLAEFRRLYAPPVEACAPAVRAVPAEARGAHAPSAAVERSLEQCVRAETTELRLAALPPRVRERVCALAAPGSTSAGAVHAAARAPRPALRAAVQSAVARVVRGPSATQSLKGVLTAGLRTSLAYALRKVRKARGAG